MKLEGEIDSRRQKFKQDHAKTPGAWKDDRDYVADTKDHGEVWGRISETQKELETVLRAALLTVVYPLLPHSGVPPPSRSAPPA